MKGKGEANIMDIYGIFIDASLIWIGIAVLFAIIETVTLGLTTIWFTIGGVAACIVSLLGGSVLLQIIIFLGVSAFLLYFTKPLMVRKLKVGYQKTNVDALSGQIALVVKDIIPHSTGQVKINGIIWTALSDNKEITLIKGTEVRIERVEGVKLIVTPINHN